MFIVTMFLALLPAGVVRARQAESGGAYYLVQPGDSLWTIAVKFRVSVDDLSALNQITNLNQLTIGARLLIPGLEGYTGAVTARPVAFGESVFSLSRRYSLPVATLALLNHLAVPGDLYAGAWLVLPEESLALPPTRRAAIQPGLSLLELAVLQGANPWSYVTNNQLAGSWEALPGESLHLPGGEATAGETSSALPEVIQSIELTPTIFVQGQAAVIEARGLPGMTFGGSLLDFPLHFGGEESGEYISLQGVHAMTKPGLYTMVLTATLPGDAPYFSAPFAYSQSVLIRSGNYPFDPVLTVSPETIDPAVTRPEDAQWAALSAPFSPERLWSGPFLSPAPDPYKECWPSRFGNRRSYNGSAYVYFHTGLDFCGQVGVDILAPAKGKVVFAGPLTVRGNATMIDHGWGVYTGYLHQSEIFVKVGDTVEVGQLIGKVGGTGRVTGPHLHWEVWVGGVQVDPLNWLTQIYLH